MSDRARVSPHFTAAEFDCHDGRRWPPAARSGLEQLARQVLEPVRAEFGPVRVHSGYRHAAYNRSIGGARASFHIYELRAGKWPAADVEPSRGSVREWWELIDSLQRDHPAARGGLGFYPRGGFVHVDLRPYLARWDGS